MRKVFVIPDDLYEHFCKQLTDNAHTSQDVLLNAVKQYIAGAPERSLPMPCGWCGTPIAGTDHAIVIETAIDPLWYDTLSCFEHGTLDSIKVSWLDIWTKPYPEPDLNTWAITKSGTRVIAARLNRATRRPPHCKACGEVISGQTDKDTVYQDVALYARSEAGSSWHLNCVLPPKIRELTFKWAVKRAAPNFDTNTLTLR